jgi:hypothetical protein
LARVPGLLQNSSAANWKIFNSPFEFSRADFAISFPFRVVNFGDTWFPLSSFEAASASKFTNSPN